MTRRCFWDIMELWYFGMSFAGSQYMDGLEGQRGRPTTAPPGGPAAVWLAVFFKVWFSVTSDLILGWVFALRRYCARRTNRAHFPYPLHPILLLINREAEINCFHSESASIGAISSPVFWMVPIHFGPKALPPSCTSWLACHVPPLLGLCGAAEAPENRFCCGWLQWTGCSSWNCCLEWEEELLLVDVRDH